MVDRFREARDRGGAYLVGLQNEDGSLPGHEIGVGAYWGMALERELERLLAYTQRAGRSGKSPVIPCVGISPVH